MFCRYRQLRKIHQRLYLHGVRLYVLRLFRFLDSLAIRPLQWRVFFEILFIEFQPGVGKRFRFADL